MADLIRLLDPGYTQDECLIILAGAVGTLGILCLCSLLSSAWDKLNGWRVRHCLEQLRRQNRHRDLRRRHQAYLGQMGAVLKSIGRKSA